MSTLDFQTDEFLNLLTDALRAGPGSPQWHDAVARLRTSPGMDEYKLLVAAREHLESGKPYRSIRPGPEFTRKVLAGVADEARAEQESAGGRRASPSTATIIATLAALVGIAVLAVVGYWMFTGGKGEHAPTADDLALQPFDRIVSSEKFDAGVPAGWKLIGPLPLKADAGGLRLASGNKAADQGGGLVREEGLPASQPFELEVTVRYPGGANVVPEVFVTDNPDFANNSAGTSPHEFVWAVLDDKAQVELPDQTLPFSDAGVGRQTQAMLPVKIKMNDRFVIVETGGTNPSHWAGAHQLDPNKPRYVGVRFLVRKPEGSTRVGIESIRVSKP